MKKINNDTKKTRGIYKGAMCAAVTPFIDGEIDFDSLGNVLRHITDGGVKAVVVCGTTGESSTLTDVEQADIVKYAVTSFGERARIYCGASSNSSFHAAKRAASAVHNGASGVLCVTPYYNKCSEDGMVLHYKMISSAVQNASEAAEVILYDVPSRTGNRISLSVLDRLAECDNIVGIKEASGDIRRVTEILSHFGDRYAVYSGCDELNQAIMAVGGVGCISVLANIFPEKVVQMCEYSLSGETEKARILSDEMRPVVNELFSEVNPIPVKAILSDMNICREEYRLPLCPMHGESRERLRYISKIK